MILMFSKMNFPFQSSEHSPFFY